MTAQTQSKEELKDPEWVTDIAKKRIVYAVPGMNQVKVHKNAIYKQVSDTHLEADVYLPPKPLVKDNNPCVVIIHGGYLPANLLTKPKEWGSYVSYGELLAASGLTCLTFNHRYFGWEYLAEAQDDVWDAVQYVRQEAKTHGIDPERISVWTFSGGGAFLSRFMEKAPSYIRAIISYYAILNFQHIRDDIPETVTDETLQTHSPVYHMQTNGQNIAPIYIARAGLDRPSINEAVDQFIQAAFEQNAMLDINTHPEGHHAFDLMDDNDRTRLILQQTIDFIKVHNGV